MKLVAALSLTLSLVAGSAFAQAFPPNEAGVTMGHWHLNSKDVEANKKFFVALGGKSIKPGNFEIVMFPGVAVFLQQGPGTPPAVGGSAGTIVNHGGFLVPNVQAAVARWKAAGLTPDPQTNGRTDQAYFTTADGLRIEILEDKAQTIPIRHHHLHYYVPEAEIPKIRDWYAKYFGAKPGMRGQNVAADLPGANLSFSKSDTALVSTKGHIMDHIGFDVKNLKAFMDNLAAQGVKIERPFTPNPAGGGLGFVSDPWGTFIELNERPTPLG